MSLQGRGALWDQGGDGEAIWAQQCSKAIIILKKYREKVEYCVRSYLEIHYKHNYYIDNCEIAMLQSLQYRLQRCKHVFSDGSVCRSNQVDGTPVCLESDAVGRSVCSSGGEEFLLSWSR